MTARMTERMSTAARVIMFAALVCFLCFGPLGGDAAAQTVSINPGSGEVQAAPRASGTAAVVDSDASLSMASENLAPVSSVVEGGGVMVDLQGRFRSIMSVNVKATGEVDSHCGHEHAQGRE